MVRANATTKEVATASGESKIIARDLLMSALDFAFDATGISYREDNTPVDYVALSISNSIAA